MLRRFFSFRRPKLDEKETVDELEKENIAPNSQVQINLKGQVHDSAHAH